MVDFAGYLMPIQYANLSIVDSHHQTRHKASLFDVSHMLQTRIHGKDRIEFIESLTVADVTALQANQSTLTLFTNENGGVIDDLIVTNTSDGYLYVVSNAGCRVQDKLLIDTQLQAFKQKAKDVHVEYVEESGLVALQGPSASTALQKLVDYDLSAQKFMTSRLTTLCGATNCRVTRCGYTGEDGFEISVPSEKAELVSETLLSSLGKDVQLAGLGARDTLRLEAGLCLYGNELDEKTTPVEAGLVWTIGKRRRALGDFPGASVILKQIKEKPGIKRVGLTATENGPPARSNAAVYSVDGERVGMVKSGCPSPTLKKNICMAYVSLHASKIGSRVKCDVRGKQLNYDVVKMPWVATNYYT